MQCHEGWVCFSCLFQRVWYIAVWCLRGFHHNWWQFEPPEPTLSWVYMLICSIHTCTDACESPVSGFIMKDIVIAGVQHPIALRLALILMAVFISWGQPKGKLGESRFGPLRGSDVLNVPWGTGSGSVNNGFIIWLIIYGTSTPWTRERKKTFK